ncbi:tripartite motif-containing protein 16-like protein isoform X2 [Misgurnus anguillicaudatus]|uniref:tripartite motif-containing protein 16-like protein isoform X2 n=1 Tax=Misgurnus anguillicaudatus TaxID=75329 RepID=UPI003CCF1AC7
MRHCICAVSKMAEANISVSQDQFNCSVCLDLLKDPVTVPCGHSYCMSCITDYWDQDDLKRDYSCPQCRQTFTTRPVVGKATMLAEVVEKLKKTKLQIDRSALSYAGPEDVKCDVCTERKHKAVKSCLRLLEDKQRKLQQRIQEKEKKLQDLREAVKIHTISAQTAVDDTERIFTQLITSIERRRSEVTQLIRDQEKTAVSEAEGLLKRLEQEIDDLRRRDAELEQLSHTDDHISFLQSFQSLFSCPGSSDIITVNSLFSFDDVRKSVTKLKEKMDDFCKEEIEKISEKVSYIEIIPISGPKTIAELLLYSSLFSLDPNTAHKRICLSEEKREATNTDTVQQYPDHPDRFNLWSQVLCSESVSGRCYWEVEWSGKCVFISVSYKSISRMGMGDERGFGFNDQSWSLSCSSSECSFYHNNIKTNLPLVSNSSRIGVYVDHSAGSLSFYSVSDTITLIHRVNTTFNKPLYPGFGLHRLSKVKLCELTI